MLEKVGPFRVEFPMKIDVLDSRELSYIKAQASGNDSKIGSRLKVELEVNLTGDGDQTKLALTASVDILGKLATLGHSMIKRKADQVMDEFAGNLKQKLEANA
jgi:carbon monoxide dehydrogenase subunit G